MALSDLTVRQAKATGTTYTLGDIDGLSLHVSAHGGKSWHFRYYWQGKQKPISLGTYPETSLRQARQSRDEARALLAGAPIRKCLADSKGWPPVKRTRTPSVSYSRIGKNAASWKSKPENAARMPK
jgi:hypothetical protein